MKNTANRKTDQLSAGSEHGFSLSLSPTPVCTSREPCEEQIPCEVISHQRFLFQFTATQFLMSPCGLGSGLFLTDHRTVQGQKGFHSPWEPPAACPQPTSQADLVLKTRNTTRKKKISPQTAFEMSFFLFGRQLPNFVGDYFCVVAARSEPEP